VAPVVSESGSGSGSGLEPGTAVDADVYVWKDAERCVLMHV
jgi:hypothetical protein